MIDREIHHPVRFLSVFTLRTFDRVAQVNPTRLAALAALCMALLLGVRLSAQTALNFGTVAIATTTPQTLTSVFTFGTSGTILSPSVLTEGASGQDFRDAGTGTCTTNGTGHVYSVGDTCTVDVSFVPKFAGDRDGAVELLNNSGTPILMAYVYGVGLGPQIGFGPGTLSLLGTSFNDPQGVAVDGAGNVFVGDTANNAVKEIPVAGGAVASLGSGFSQPQGVAVDGAGNVFVADTENSAVKELLAPLYSTVITLGSGFDRPTALAVDEIGNVFVNDTGDDSVKEILAAGGYVTVNTVASGVSFPSATEAVGANGNLFVADTYNNRVLKLDYADPPRLTFQATALGSTSNDSPQTVEIESFGNQPLILTGLAFPADFPEALSPTNGCTNSTSLNPGQLCHLAIDFTPHAPDSFSERVVVTDNALNVARAQQSISVIGNASGALTAATLNSPAPGTVLSGNAVPFSWTTAPGTLGYSLWLGSTGVGSSNLYNSHATTATSLTAAGLPINGETIYARLNTRYDGVSLHMDYTFTAVTLTPASLANPMPDTTLASPNVTFSWSAATGATYYSLWLGSTGVGSSNLYNSHATTATSLTAAGLPINGETIYARLSTNFSGLVQYFDYTYTAVTLTPASLANPMPGTTLASPNVTFSWSAATGATYYSLWLGSTGVGSSNLYNSHATTATSVTARGLPINGETIYARLSTNFSGLVQYFDYTYTAQ